MTGINITDDYLHQEFISSMVSSYIDVPVNNIALPMQKQEQYTQECLIKIGPETSL